LGDFITKKVIRSALVTGGNRGIGLAVAKQLAKLGNYDVIIGARDLDLAEREAKKIARNNTTVVAIELDVMKQESVENAALMANSKFRRLDVLINNAGILIDESDRPSETSLDAVRETLETNLLGPWRMCKTFLPLMKRNNYGRIVNVSSGAGTIESISESPYAPAYSLSKFALNGLTMMVARETRGTNILVNSMDPGWVRTDMGGSSAPRSVDQGADTVVWLATLPEGGPTGGFFRDRNRANW
jgi:NAD(P)-dependent dehydrogenase (short-subunit alcohol dehydrogenase family)